MSPSGLIDEGFLKGLERTVTVIREEKVLKVSGRLVIKPKLTAQLNLSVIMHKTSVGTKSPIKRDALNVNSQKVRCNMDWT